MNMSGLCEADLDVVVAISAESFSPPWPRAAFASELARSVTASLALRDETGVVQAYVLYWLMFQEAHIVSIATVEAHRRKGYAEALLAAVLKTPGVEACFLEVRVGNAPAIALYEKVGFARFDVRKRYYHDGEDALVLRWTPRA